MNKYYMLSQQGETVDIYIFGDIVVEGLSWYESDVSSYSLAREIKQLEGVKKFVVHINSYGGHASEGMAIYNTLKNHGAEVVTICEGFACSAASIVFMAGDERIMENASLLMIHDAWTIAAGNSQELHKQAEDIGKISDTAANAYRDAGLSVSDDELKQMLADETWITPGEALKMGFATAISQKKVGGVAADAKKAAYTLMLAGITARADSVPQGQSGIKPPDAAGNDGSPVADNAEAGSAPEDPAGGTRPAGKTAGILKAIAKFIAEEQT